MGGGGGGGGGWFGVQNKAQTKDLNQQRSQVIVVKYLCSFSPALKF